MRRRRRSGPDVYRTADSGRQPAGAANPTNSARKPLTRCSANGTSRSSTSALDV